MKLFDLAGAADDLRFSPNCWRIKMALAHKGLAAEAVPWRFVEKDAIAASGQKTVPVLVDDDRIVSDSWEIAKYLEITYSGPQPIWRPRGRRAGVVYEVLVRADTESHHPQNHSSGSVYGVARKR
jgi:glutathione S-transferase